MQPSIHKIKSFSVTQNLAILLTEGEVPDETGLNEAEKEWVQKKLEAGSELISLNRYSHHIFILRVKKKNEKHQTLEAYRQQAFQLHALLAKEDIRELQLVTQNPDPDFALAFLESLMLSSYTFRKYKTDKKDINNVPERIEVFIPAAENERLQEIKMLAHATMVARDLVNEPVIYLSAIQLSRELERLGEEAGFHTEVFEESKIQSLKMGGLLAVNAGSQQPPTFSVLEHKPKKAVNSQPVVLVGKGVVYDTGGLSLKPTPGSMDMMKSDMAGAAAVAGAIYAIAANNLPVHVVGLIPATDNRPGENAMTPGDVITMCNGKTVEILNTDAEGRLILADALTYAKKYNPLIVIDLATLTGSAMRALGPEGIVCMGTAGQEHKEALFEAGKMAFERMVEFPLWEEYEKQLESDIADLNNLGGTNAGAITAGLFLKHFTDYPWMHLDIAGPAFLTRPDAYRGKGGSGTGVRLLYHFVKSFDKK